MCPWKIPVPRRSSSITAPVHVITGTMGVKLILLNILGIFALSSAQCSPGLDFENENDIFFRFYNGSIVDEYDDIFAKDVGSLASILNENSKPTAFYIHGYSESVEKESVKSVVGGYLKRQDHNVIAIDWRKISQTSYFNNVMCLRAVGNEITVALVLMFSNGFDINRVHIISHSFGSQIAGYVGRALNSTIPRITGLDPAGPLFNALLPQLTESDARFVDIIHTDLGVYGVYRGSGTVNFYPNGGHRVQPGCPRIFVPTSNEDFCSHHRSWEFYTESLTDERAFVSVKCDNEAMFRLGQCANNDQALMGIAGFDKNKTGHYYLTTNSQQPFGLKTKGIIA